jgi:hypothetical protein
VKILNDDPEKIIDLNETDPEVVKTFLEKYYNGSTVEEYLEIRGITMDYSDPKVTKARIEREANRIATDRMINEKRDEFIAKLKMSDEEKADFIEEFEDRRSRKTFDSKDIVKHLEKSYREVAKDPQNLKEIEKASVIGKSQATVNGSNNSGSEKKTSFDREREQASDFLKKFNII